MISTQSIPHNQITVKVTHILKVNKPQKKISIIVELEERDKNKDYFFTFL